MIASAHFFHIFMTLVFWMSLAANGFTFMPINVGRLEHDLTLPPECRPKHRIARDTVPICKEDTSISYKPQSDWMIARLKMNTEIHPTALIFTLVIAFSCYGATTAINRLENLFIPSQGQTTTLVISVDEVDSKSSQLLDAFGAQLLQTGKTPMGSGTENAPPSSANSEESSISSDSDMKQSLQELRKRKRIDPRTHG